MQEQPTQFKLADCFHIKNCKRENNTSYDRVVIKTEAETQKHVGLSGCPPVREKSGKFGFSSRSGKSQGIL